MKWSLLVLAALFVVSTASPIRTQTPATKPVSAPSKPASVTLRSGDRWPGFRNDGSNHSQSKNLPIRWSPKSGIAWQRELPGYGQSSPLLWDGRLYLTLVEGPMKNESIVIALDAASGNTLWQSAISTTSQAANYRAKSRAAPTPVVDAAGIYAFFEGGDVLALSHDGKVKWKRHLTKEYGEFENGHGLGSSLAQTDDAVIVLIDHKGPSYLLALDKKTGKNRWKVERKPRSSWTSPVVADLNGRRQIVISSNGTVDGYDAKSGAPLWSVPDIGGNTIPSVTVADGRVFAGAAASRSGRNNSPRACCCIDVTGEEKLVAKVRWRAKRARCHYVSPLVVDGYVYHVNKAGVVFCIDAATGETIYKERTAGMCWATPIAANGHIYFFARDGQATVIKTGRKFEQVAVNALWDLDEPPAPETYVPHRPKSTRRRSPLATLQNADKNKDGRITKDELPSSMQRFFSQMDANSDGAVDKAELEAASARLRRGSGSGSDAYNEPILYGVAVGDGAFFVRTGTRMYCVRGAETDGRNR